MKKTIASIAFSLLLTVGYAQTDKAWTAVSKNNVKASKTTERLSFPTDFQLYKLNAQSIRSVLQNAPIRNVAARQQGVIISLPNINGNLERFEMVEASNFTAEFQSSQPSIRAYAGKGLTDPNATVRISVDPSGIQAMIFRTDKRNEFIENYSENGEIYAVYNASRNKGNLPFTCSTDDVAIASSIGSIQETNRSNTSELLTFRLALSCNGEYTTYFGGTVAGALAAMNATMTRVNGVFEMDFAIHMNMINNTAIIYTNASTDPYTSMGQWNGQLQNALTLNVGEANYDVGHMFGASGGGGNAGCIGCVCVNNQKGSGITSPADGVPMGDNFDIDYVAHELGHQFGGNHTFSNNTEGSGVNVEPGSGSTIMGYAGITSQDIANHSDAYFVYATIKQVQDNMVGKSCPVRTPLANTAPTVDAGIDYIIPISTPYVLTGAATDVDGDTLLYCWEQNDSAGSGQTGNNSQASPTKTGGPNWRSYNPTASPSRYFPPLPRVVNNQLTSVFGSITTEAISSVARVCNFALTVRDRNIEVGQTGTDFMKVTTTAAAGPFVLNTPNTNLSVMAGTNYDVTWNVAGTTANGVNAATVDIFLSTDGGLTFPITLISDVANDGAQSVTFPDIPGTANRVMVKGHNHIFYDISNTNFTIITAATTFLISATAGADTLNTCQGNDVAFSIDYGILNGFSGTTNLTVAGAPADALVTVSPNPISAVGLVNLQINTTATTVPGNYAIVVTGTSGSEVKTLNLTLNVYAVTFPTMVLSSPANAAVTQPTTLTLQWQANTNATEYFVQVSTDINFATTIAAETVATTSYSLSGLSSSTTYYWRVEPRNPSCNGLVSDAFTFQTGLIECNVLASTNVPLTISTSGAPTINSTFVVPAGSGAVISDINVTMNITHTWVRDLTVTLISPAGTQVRLVDRPCTNTALNNIVATFDDAGIAVICANNPAVGGTVIPTDALSILNGENSAGTWTLRVKDNASQDGGALNSWSMNICSIGSLAVAQNQFTDFGLYPNPNNGNFNIQFKANTTDDVNVNVHDIRGRKIFSQTYKTSGLFNENLQLNNPSRGVYFVTVTNGNSKEVRKIVVE